MSWTYSYLSWYHIFLHHFYLVRTSTSSALSSTSSSSSTFPHYSSHTSFSSFSLSSYSIISSPFPAPSSPLTLIPLAHMTGYGVLIVDSISSSDWGTNELVLARSPRPQFPVSFCPLFIANSSSISFLKYLTCEVKFLIKTLPTCNVDVKASKTKQTKTKEAS